MIMRRLAGLVFLSIALVSSCSISGQAVEGSAVVRATNYCPQIIDSLEDFDSAVASGMSGRSDDTLAAIEATVQDLTNLVRRAENDGVDLYSPDSIWFGNLKSASIAFLQMVNGDTKHLTETEQQNIVWNILEHFESSALACSPAKV